LEAWLDERGAEWCAAVEVCCAEASGLKALSNWQERILNYR